MRKVHLSLPVRDLAATEAFYAALFDDQPSKKKSDYLKFEPEELALNISFVPIDTSERRTRTVIWAFSFPRYKSSIWRSSVFRKPAL